MTSNKINNKSIARIAAIQVLYQFNDQNQSQNIDLLMQNILDFYSSNEASNDDSWQGESLKIRPSTNYLRKLINTTSQNLEQIDGLIDNNLTSEWQLGTLPTLLLAILRVGIGELLFFPETPHKVVINEYTDIAGDMLNDNEIGFVNSILDKIHQKRS